MDHSELDDMHLRKMTLHKSSELFILRELKPSTSARAGGSKVAEVLDTIGSRLSSLNSVGEFVSITASRSNTVSILAFEVANTIVKGSNLMQSLSKENIQIFKKEILHSEGVQLLVSTDMKKLLSIAAADKRFGNLCIDPQWHNLDRYLERLNRFFLELYHELEALDKMEQHYRRRLEEVQSLHLLRKGKSELKHHKKLVRKLKKRSLWPIILEEVVEKLADVVIFIHQEISEAFENDAHSTMNGKSIKEPERLGVTGLALHYANLITQMNCIASRPTCLIPNMRVTLYNNLPASVKSELRSSLQALDSPEVMTVSQIKAEMDKTLNWLVPLATDTTKAHHGFGFVGEWANTGFNFELLTYIIWVNTIKRIFQFWVFKMGGVCTGGTLKRSTAADYGNDKGSVEFSGKLRSVKSFSNHHQQQQQKKNDYNDGNGNGNDDSILSSSYTQDDDLYHRKTTSYDSGELFFSISRELKPSTPARVGASKAPHVSTFLGKAGSVGLEVLDTLGSSMSNLNSHSGFVSNTALRGNKVSILAFEVANTIVKGSNLMQSLSEENIQILKKEILHSEGVQLLVSTDMKELLCIAAADKREEFEIFSREVVRFGDMCKDPQWHNLDRFFVRLDLDPVTNKQLREEAEITMQELANLAQHTSPFLARYKLQIVFMMLNKMFMQELYHEYHALDRFEQDYRRKLEEVESLHLPRKGESLMILQSELKHQRKLVRNLKKKSLWSKSLEEVVEKLVDVVTFIHQAIAEAFEENATSSTMNGKDPNKKRERLGVAATDTTKNEFGKKTAGSNNIIRLQTLYHADKQKMDRYILDLIIWLHRLISLVRYRDNIPKYTPSRSPPTSKTLNLHSNGKHKRIEISSEDKNLLEEVPKRRTLVPGVSKSQEFVMVKKKRRAEIFASSRSMGSSPRRDLKYANANMLDVLDGIGTTN
ncbi:Protein of unknown function DUF3475 [Cynara cardunculus var. scolymus]|uniref:DUF3475 domain-containing protein n=1 Tax=Cynara cardunculus var. scolymus TaxID=59895 RepID=A0A124SGX7_CYNCS|nr:Protein of unknown function DUF3475 [Cynara cardunculus var. scolymus]